jgi:DNA-binding MarR family transcriptional regulator
MKDVLAQLNKSFENRVRLAIMAVLSVNDTVTFNSMKELLQVTDGNLATHLKMLENMNYITSMKQFISRKPNTTYQITDHGKYCFQEHLNALEQLLK